MLVLFVPHPNKYHYGIRKDLAAQLRTLPVYILVVPTIKDFITQVTWLVFLQTIHFKIYRDIIYPFLDLRASTHERPPCVLRHTSNVYAVAHIFTHTLLSTIETAPKRSTLNGQRCIRYQGNIFTSRTKSSYGTPKGTRVPRYTVMSNRITGLHLVTLPYEMAVITITRWEICTPYQVADSDRLV